MYRRAHQVCAVARWLDGELARRPYVAGERFTVADITAFVALEFARGLMKFSAGDEDICRLTMTDGWNALAPGSCS